MWVLVWKEYTHNLQQVEHISLHSEYYLNVCYYNSYRLRTNIFNKKWNSRFSSNSRQAVTPPAISSVTGNWKISNQKQQQNHYDNKRQWKSSKATSCFRKKIPTNSLCLKMRRMIGRNSEISCCVYYTTHKQTWRNKRTTWNSLRYKVISTQVS